MKNLAKKFNNHSQEGGDCRFGDETANKICVGQCPGQNESCEYIESAIDTMGKCGCEEIDVGQPYKYETDYSLIDDPEGDTVKEEKKKVQYEVLYLNRESIY